MPGRIEAGREFRVARYCLNAANPAGGGRIAL